MNDIQTRLAMIESYSRAMPHATLEYKVEWNATKCMIHDKMFALIGHDKHGLDIITLKLEPSYGEYLRDHYEKIVPGYYMNKRHWVSVYLDSDIEDRLIEDLIRQAYQTVFHTLPKKLQQTLIDEA